MTKAIHIGSVENCVRKDGNCGRQHEGTSGSSRV